MLLIAWSGIILRQFDPVGAFNVIDDPDMYAVSTYNLHAGLDRSRYGHQRLPRRTSVNRPSLPTDGANSYLVPSRFVTNPRGGILTQIAPQMRQGPHKCEYGSGSACNGRNEDAPSLDRPR